MNELTQAVLRAALQGTVLAVAAVPLYLFAARRGPRTASLMASLYLTVSIAVVLAAHCPQPGWWTWEQPLVAKAENRLPSPAAAASVPASPVETGSGEQSGLSWSSLSRRAFWQQVGTLGALPSPVDPWWTNLVAFVFLAGGGLCLARLLASLWAVRTLRLRSRPITDTGLLSLLASLRSELAYPRPVVLAESRDLGTPATIGWRRPLVLLPTDWPEWTDGERRAVLAHELAHISRADYLTGLVARVSIALQFYQPLVYWLAGRLRLQQELAADALAAQLSGGRGPYLRALSRMVLRQADRPRTCPAPTFLSFPGTLMRRIQMLRANDCSPERTVSRSLRIGLTAALVLIAAAVSTLRTPAQKPEQSRPALSEARDVGTPQTGQPPAFDLSYLGPDFPGVFAFRPAAVLGRPELKKLMPFLDRQFQKGFKDFVETRADIDLRLEEIEQVVCPTVIRTNKNLEPDRRSQLLTTLNLVRTVHDYDWKRLVKAVIPDVEEAAYAGKVYYRSTGKAKIPALLGMFPSKVCFYIPDSRTLVILPEPSLRLVLDGKAPRPIWADDWKEVEHGLFAVAFDSRDKSWMDGRVQPPADEVEAAAEPIAKQARSVVMGAEATKGLSCRFILRGENAEAGRAIAAAAGKLLELSRNTLLKDLSAKPAPPGTVEAIGVDLFGGLLRRTQIHQEGACVTVHSEVKQDLGQLLTAIMAQVPPEMLK